MPYQDPDPTDPTMLIGVEAPAGPASDTEMAYVFAEEFARMGMDAAEILELFGSPFYAGAHQAYRALGDAAVRTVVDECVAVSGRAAGRIQEAPAVLGGDVQWLPWPAVSGPLGTTNDQ